MSYKRVVMTGYGDPNVLKVVEEAGMPADERSGDLSLSFGPEVPKSPRA